MSRPNDSGLFAITVRGYSHCTEEPSGPRAMSKHRSGTQASSASSTANQNIFSELETKFGVGCYGNIEKLKKVKNIICRHIQSCCGYKKVVRDIVRAALDFYKSHVARAPDVPIQFCGCIIGSAENLIGALVIAVHICQKYDLRDDPDLEVIARIIYTVDGGFDRFLNIFDPLLFPFEVDHILFQLGADEVVIDDMDKHLRVIEYFLRELGNMKVDIMYTQLDLTNQGPPYARTEKQVRFVDAPLASCRGSTPLLLACHALSAEAVLLLLRYGADPLGRGQLHEIIGLQFQHPLFVLISKLNAAVFWRTHNIDIGPSAREQVLASQLVQENDARLCLRYFCRVLPQLPIICSRSTAEAESNTSGAHYYSSRGDGTSFHLHPQQRDCIPPDRWTEPAALVHLCRCAIRLPLRERGQLPDGIARLPVPLIIKDYLDLAMD